MTLIQEGLEDRNAYSWQTLPIYLQVCSGSWQPASASAGNIIGSEVLDSRILIPAPNITMLWDAITSRLNVNMEVSVTAGLTSINFNRLGLLRGGDLVSKYNGTFTSTTTINLSTAHTFVIGDRIVYNGVTYLLTNVAGTILTIGTPAFPASGSGFIRSGRGKQYAGFVLSPTRQIIAGSTAVLIVTGDSYAL